MATKTAISKTDLLKSMETLQSQLDSIKALLNTKKTTVSKKPTVKTVVKKAVNKATKTASPSNKRWYKFSLDNLPKAYTFLKVSFKDASKSQFGRFLHTSITKDKHIYIDVVDNKKNTIRIPFQNIKQVYEYR